MLNLIERLELGAPVVMVVPSLLEGVLVHPYTEETVGARVAPRRAPPWRGCRLAVALMGTERAVPTQPRAEGGTNKGAQD